MKIPCILSTKDDTLDEDISPTWCFRACWNAVRFGGARIFFFIRLDYGGMRAFDIGLGIMATFARAGRR